MKPPVPRTLTQVLAHHASTFRQMAFVVGPRQVGKTTVCSSFQPAARTFNWDDEDHRRVITRGTAAIADELGLARLHEGRQVVVFDELHKYRRWRTFLKGLFDRHSADLSIVVTGSSRLDFYRKGGDSLMGRYFDHRLHPLSVGELVDPAPLDDVLRPPRPIADDAWGRLLQHGGFPEPFVHADHRFSLRWQKLRREQLVRGDIRDLTRIQEVDQVELLVRHLESRSATQIEYAALARDVRVSADTLRRWIEALQSLYHGFLLRPWFTNVARSLRKEPKWYLRDWSHIADRGARVETFVACHLLKAVETWEDAGLGEFKLHFLRDKDRREVDFVVVRDGAPWFLIEVKASDDALSPALGHFQRQLGAPHAFQLVIDAPYVDVDPFTRREPCSVPARTLLSQLP